VLAFYQWEGDVKLLLEDTRRRIDAIAATWTEDEKQVSACLSLSLSLSLSLWLIDPDGQLPQACLEETLACFKFGGGLMVSLMPPNMQASA
jgi:hypothetical protein